MGITLEGRTAALVDMSTSRLLRRARAGGQEHTASANRAQRARGGPSVPLYLKLQQRQPPLQLEQLEAYTAHALHTGTQ